jgi:hypothetical protein
MSDADRDDVIDSGTASEIYVDGVADCWQRGSIARIRQGAARRRRSIAGQPLSVSQRRLVSP